MNKFGIFLIAKVKREDLEANKTIEIIQNKTKKDEVKQFVRASMSSISSTGGFILNLNSMIDPFQKYKNLKFEDVFESYIEA